MTLSRDAATDLVSAATMDTSSMPAIAQPGRLLGTVRMLYLQSLLLRSLCHVLIRGSGKLRATGAR